MDEKTMWIVGGGVAVVLALVMSRGGSGATIINPKSDPNAAASDTARADFASRGLDSLSRVAIGATNADVSKYMAASQVVIQRSRDAAYENAANAAAEAQKESARAAGRGKSGFSIPTPFGSFSIHW